MGKPKDLGHLAHIVSYDASNNITLPGSITMHTNQLVASQSWVTTALGSYALSSSLGSYVPTSRTITINGTSYDLSADRSWNITSMIYPAAGIPLSTGSAWGTSITNNSANWNTAYGWGNHASAGYLTGITSTLVTTALGYTPVTNARTITINGTAYDLSADRSWTVSGSDATKLPLAGGTMTGLLAFSNVTGNKIDFYHSTTGSGDRYGIQVQDSELRIHCGAAGSSTGGITFGKSTTTTFTEYLRVRNDGIVQASALLVVNATGIANSPSLRINTSSSATFIHTQENFAANMTAGQHAMIWAGKVGSSKNAGGFGYYWAADASNSNFVTIGHWGNDDILRVYGDSSVTMSGTLTVAGNVYLNSTTYAFGANYWAGTSGYPGYQFTGGNTRFGFSSTSGAVDVYTDGNFYAGIDYNGSNNLVWHAGNMNAPNRSGTSYYQVETWLQLTGVHGLYCPSVNGAHFYPNDASYGAWRVSGTRNGWNGMHFGGGNGMTLMMNETEFGFHREGYGWYARFTSGRFYGNSDYAYSAGNADTVDGWHRDDLRAWGGLTGIPSNLTYWNAWYGGSYLGSDGNLYLGWAGKWLSTALGEKYSTGGGDINGNVTIYGNLACSGETYTGSYYKSGSGWDGPVLWNSFGTDHWRQAGSAWFTYTSVGSTNFFSTSRRAVKTQIQSFDRSAVDLINTVDIVEYNYKNDLNNKRIGFIAEDTIAEIATESHDQMDINSSIGLLLKAVQELSAENKQLRIELNELKTT